MNFLASLLLAITLLGAAFLLVILGGNFWLLWLHVRLRARGLADEAALLARTLPPDLPDVTLQIPVFNEGAIVQRAIRAAAALDWPAHRLHIQILDDSTDDTTALARAAAAEFSGRDIAVLHRTDRTGFKAGALQAGMAAQPGCEYFGILDVDYLPPKDFLQSCMRALLADPRRAFAQARFDFLNADANALTRIQTIILDAHLAVEQATRSWAGHPLPFNGTGGIWRRAAIEAAGGWRGDTLAEDLDLSYRAWLAGWRGIFLVTVAVPGELPADRAAWVAQQRRWSKGSGEIARRMFSVVRGARHLGRRAQLGALLHLGTWWSTPIIFLTVPAGIAAGLLRPALLPWLGGMALGFLLLAEMAVFIFWRLGNLLLRDGGMTLPRFVLRCLQLQAIALLTILRNALGYAEAILARRSVFQRTPKQGAASK